MDWRLGSSDRMPTLQVQSPEFKLQFYQKKKEKYYYVRARCGGAHLQSQLLRRLRQKDHEFQASLSYKERPSQKKLGLGIVVYNCNPS
jgi:hypothetical protein